MDCSKAREYMSEALDENLEKEEKEAFFYHLEHCPACKKQWEQMNRTVEFLQNQPEKECPEEVIESVKQEIKKEDMSQKKGQKRRIFGMVGICAAVAVVAVCATLFATQGFKQNAPLVASAETAEAAQESARKYAEENGAAADTGDASSFASKAYSIPQVSQSEQKVYTGEVSLFMPEGLLENKTLQGLEYEYIEEDALYIKVTEENRGTVNAMMKELNLDLTVNAGQTVKFTERNDD